MEGRQYSLIQPHLFLPYSVKSMYMQIELRGPINDVRVIAAQNLFEKHVMSLLEEASMLSVRYLLVIGFAVEMIWV